MRKISLLFVLASLVFLVACNDDEDSRPTNVLRHDGDNRTAPFLEQGDYEAAARFTAEETMVFEGQLLERVSFFIAELPSTCEVRIYQGGTDQAPGQLVYSADVSNAVEPLQFNDHALRDDITINDEDLWVSIFFSHGGRQQTIGCDAGPRDPNGDWITENQQWTNFQQFSGGESINWNIRVFVAE